MLDTRQYDRDLTDLYYNTDDVRKLADQTNRSMTGSSQQQWFFDQLSSSQKRGATWKLVMQQVVFGKVNYTEATAGATDFDFDAWEGMSTSRVSPNVESWLD